MNISIRAYLLNVTECLGGFLYNISFQDELSCCDGFFDMVSIGGDSAVYKQLVELV